MLVQQETINHIKVFSFWIGVFLICISVFSLLYLGTLAIHILQSPDEIGLVKSIMLSVANSDLLLNGYLNEDKVEINASAAVQYLFIGLIGLKIISILTAIFNTIIAGGIKLVLLANSTENSEQVN
ncbi:hypothetical protein TI03_00205 [Achromatium sp. WMS1]|nr:hypothetical protein TI03_00205 [Achromatium sp. WMS1]